MSNLREKILNRDPIMRMSLAFYDFVRKNNDWSNRIENVAWNRLKGVSDYDFEYDKRLYSFEYQYVDNNNVRCLVKEYLSFYDFANSFDYVLFDYSLLERSITRIHKKGTYNLAK